MAKRFLKHTSDEDREAAAERVLRHERKSLSDIVPSKKHNVISFVEEREREREAGAEKNKSRARVTSDEKVSEEDILALNNEQAEKKYFYKKWTILLSVLLLLGVGIYLALFLLPRADISVKLKITPWQFSGDVSALIDHGDILAQRFSQTKNLQLPLIATGKKFITSKAKGVIKIYNAFSSEPQALVATTRFVSPEGKIFRLNNAVTVPGAKIDGGKITPSSVDAAVSADKAGPEYNILPVSKWLIPGFKGTPKYSSFYGVSDAPMTGGLSGEKNYPKTEDIAAAKKDADKAIRDAMGGLFAVGIPSDFTVLDKSSNFKITKSEPVPTPDNSGKYVYFIEAKEDRMAIRKSDLLNLMVGRGAGELGADFIAKKTDLKFDYKNSTIGKDDTLQGVILAVTFNGDFVKKINLDDLRSRAAGKNQSDLATIILSVPGIQGAKISLWPFWVRTVPASIDKIAISAE